MKAVNVLIAGGCGFISSHLARRFAKDFSVHLLDNTTEKKRLGEAPAVLHPADLTNADETNS